MKTEPEVISPDDGPGHTFSTWWAETHKIRHLFHPPWALSLRQRMSSRGRLWATPKETMSQWGSRAWCKISPGVQVGRPLIAESATSTWGISTAKRGTLWRPSIQWRCRTSVTTDWLWHERGEFEEKLDKRTSRTRRSSCPSAGQHQLTPQPHGWAVSCGTDVYVSRPDSRLCVSPNVECFKHKNARAAVHNQHGIFALNWESASLLWPICKEAHLTLETMLVQQSVTLVKLVHGTYAHRHAYVKDLKAPTVPSLGRGILQHKSRTLTLQEWIRQSENPCVISSQLLDQLLLILSQINLSYIIRDCKSSRFLH